MFQLRYKIKQPEVARNKIYHITQSKYIRFFFIGFQIAAPPLTNSLLKMDYELHFLK